jgi:hypothetical protein
MTSFIDGAKRLLRKNRKPVFGVIFSICLFLTLPLLVFLKIVFHRTILTCRINARYFGHLGFNAAIADAHASNKDFFVLASFIQPVVNSKLKGVADDSLFIVNDHVLELFEKFYYVVPDAIKRILAKFIRPMIDERTELREFIHFSKLAVSEGDWKKAFWRTVNRSQGYHNTGILVALRTSNFHGMSVSQKLESYRNMNPKELSCVLEAALSNSPQLPVTFYGSQDFFERHIEGSPSLNKVAFVDQARVDVLDLIQGAKIIINNGNGIGAVAAAANAKVLYIKHSPWHAWHTFHTMGLVIPARYSSPKAPSDSLEDLCKMALNTSTALPFDFHDNFSGKGIVLRPLSTTDMQVIASSIEEALSPNHAARVSDRYSGVTFMYSSELEQAFWRAFIFNMPTKLRSVHSDIRVKISSSYLSCNFKF